MSGEKSELDRMIVSLQVQSLSSLSGFDPNLKTSVFNKTNKKSWLEVSCLKK